MKLILSALRPLRFLLAVCVSALLLFSYAYPAFAKTSSPSDGESIDLAKKMEQRGRDILEAGKVPGLKEEQEKTANGGLNVVQGTTGIEDMKRPSNTGDVNVPEEQIQKALEKVEGK